MRARPDAADHAAAARRRSQRLGPWRTTATGVSGTTVDAERVREARGRSRRATTVGSASTRRSSEPRDRPRAGSSRASARARGEPALRRRVALRRPRSARRRTSRSRARPRRRRRRAPSAIAKATTTSERPEGDKRGPGRGARHEIRARQPGATAAAGAHGDADPRRLVPRWPPRAASPLRRLRLLRGGELDLAEELDLVLELDAELLARATARLGHQREAVRGRRARPRSR